VAEYSFLVPDLTPTQFYEELPMLHPHLLEITGAKELYFNMEPDGCPGDDYNRLVMIEPKIPDGRVAWIMAISWRGFVEIGSEAKFALGTRIIYTNGPIRGDRQHDKPLGNVFDKIIAAINARLQRMVMGNDRARGIGPLEPKSQQPQGQSERLLPSEGSPPAAASVFISYSHKDGEFLRRLMVHLRPLEQEGLIDLWVDLRLEAGDRWKIEIEEALSRARVAIMLITADFLASDFIVNNELPPLLKKARSQDTHIIPVILKPCRFTRDKNLSGFHAINDPAAPLVTLPEGEQEKIYDKISEAVERSMSNKRNVI